RCIIRQQPNSQTPTIDPQQLKLLQLILTTPEYKRFKLTDQFSKTRQLATEFCTKQLELLHYHIANNQPLPLSETKQLTKSQLVELTKVFLQTHIYLQSNTHTTLTIDNLFLSIPSY